MLFNFSNSAEIARQRAVVGGLGGKFGGEAAVSAFVLRLVAGGFCQQGEAAGGGFGLLFHIEGGEGGDALGRRAAVGAAAGVAALCGQYQTAEPGVETVLPLPDMGQLVYQPQKIAAACLRVVGQVVAAREIDAAVGRYGGRQVGQQGKTAADADSGIVEMAAEKEACGADFVVGEASGGGHGLLRVFCVFRRPVRPMPPIFGAMPLIQAFLRRALPSAALFPTMPPFEAV
ncbi:hypothetical protein HMPREF9120_00208 [Neisseria sp. oral taxon 020 str. F0370]|nr:hypothetical protein HMPREF9120_00208 [Neisseria sp. oral taxon 020 str. F0370]